MDQIIQQLSINVKHTECLDSKKETILHLAMARDIYLGEKGEDLQKSECSADSTEGNTQDECSVDEVLSKSKNYGMTWCTFTKQSEITSVCKSILKDHEGGQLLIQSLGQTIIRRDLFYSRAKAAYVNMSTCDKMTIYFYKSNLKDEVRGRHVVLNFSGSDQFLKCMYDNGKAVLTVENVWVVQPTLSLSNIKKSHATATSMTDLKESNMAQYVSEKNVLVIYLEMVWKPHLDKEATGGDSRLSLVGTAGECVVDGILQQGTIGSFEKDRESQVLIQSLYHTTLCPKNIKPRRRRACIDSTASTSDITIYYYKSNTFEGLKGVPVVLNVTDSNTFLKCTDINGKAVLSVQCWEKEKLNSIYKNDPNTQPFLFYLTCTKDNFRHFESAECAGWFIRTESNVVSMDEKEHIAKDPAKFSFIIACSPNATKSK